MGLIVKPSVLSDALALYCAIPIDIVVPIGLYIVIDVETKISK